MTASRRRGRLGATAVVEEVNGGFDLVVDGAGGATFGLAIGKAALQVD